MVKLNLHKIFIKEFWCLTFVENTLAILLLGFFNFKLFICPPDVKRPKFFGCFTLWIPTKAPLWTRCRAYRTLRPSPAFYNIWKLSLNSKTDISKTAWISFCSSGLCHAFKDLNVSDEHVLQLDFEIVNDGKHKQKFPKCIKNLKINQVETVNLFITEIKRIQLEHALQFAASYPEIL